jgi:mannose-6-phosphate isomerase
MDRLDNPVRHYAWGSARDIPDFLGVPADGTPQAELWMGAHPGDSSRLLRGGTPASLLDLIAADPDAELGPAVAARYGARLPFLFKVLSAGQPLSLQVHPDRPRAAARFADGRYADDYVDGNHKPELICALRDGFEALCGFRPVAATIALLDELAVPGLAAGRQLLAGQPGADGLRALVTQILTGAGAGSGGDSLADGGSSDTGGDSSGAGGDSSDADGGSSGAGGDSSDAGGDSSDAGGGSLAGRGSSGAGGDSLADTIAAVGRAGRRVAGGGEWAAAGRAYALLAAAYPRDPGVLVALLLNHAVLGEGEALFVAAGVPHCYLYGFGAEVMAASDNVLRAGLTAKRVNVPELLEVLDFRPAPLQVLHPERDGPLETYPVPVPDFQLGRLALGGAPVALPGAGPQILLCIAGTARLQAADGTELELRRGESAYLPASCTGVTATGPGTVLRATVGG